MPEMPRPRPPYLQRETTRHGKTVWYVRIGAGPRTRLNAAYGSREFMDEYQAVIAGEALPAKRMKPEGGTLSWMIDHYRRSSAWASLSVATRKQRDNVFSHIIEASGDLPHNGMTSKDITKGLDARAGRPAAARHFLEAMRGMFQWAVSALDDVDYDPTQGVKAPKKTGDGHHTWTEEECRRFERRWPIGTRERVAYAVLLYTGLRRGDAVRLGPDHIEDGVAMIRMEKTNDDVHIHMPPELLEVLAAGPVGETTFIAGDRGRPMVKESFGTWFRLACRAAKVPGTAHGLRKAKATRAANAGATEHELMAMHGWSSPRMASVYTRKANRRQLAIQGAEKVALSPHPKNASPHPEKSGNKIKTLDGQKKVLVGEADGE